MSFLDQEVERIRNSGVLGRSPVYGKLLEYLKQTAEQGRSAKEIDIAVEVFGRSEFDSATDSSVRVYLHNLRQRIDNYYRGPASGQRTVIQIPKGDYTLQVLDRPDDGARVAQAKARQLSWARAAGIAVAALLLGWLAAVWIAPDDELERAAATPVWQPILASEKPLVIVLGDYYMFAEVGESGVTRRLIRDFRVNSREDLETGYRDPAVVGRTFTDIRLSYLPVGAAPALADLLAVIHSSRKTVVVIPESQLDVQTVRSSDIVYVGYLSGLGLLSEFVFDSSNFALGETYDELVNVHSGEVYLSEAGFLDGPATDYLDYGFISSFAGPAGNRLLIVAGMRDEGLMQMASILASRKAIGDLMDRLPASDPGLSMEALYQVRGMHRMNISSRLVFASTLPGEKTGLKARQARLSMSPDPTSDAAATPAAR